MVTESMNSLEKSLKECIEVKERVIAYIDVVAQIARDGAKTDDDQARENTADTRAAALTRMPVLSRCGPTDPGELRETTR